MEREPKRPPAITLSPQTYIGEKRAYWKPEAGYPIAVTTSPPSTIESPPVAPLGGFIKR